MSDVYPIRVKIHATDMLWRYSSLLCHSPRFQGAINRTN